MDLTPVELVRFQRMMKQTAAKAEKLTDMPVLFLQGVNDRLIKPQGTVDLFQRLKTQDKNLLMVGTAEHLIFEQGQFDDSIIDLVSSWTNKNVVNHNLANVSPSSIAEATSAKTADGSNDESTTREALGHLKIAQGYLLLKDPVQAEIICSLRCAPAAAAVWQCRQTKFSCLFPRS